MSDLNPRPSTNMKRKAHTLSRKCEALELIGCKPDGSMSVAETNPNTGQPYKLFELAKLFNINPCVVSTWRKNAKAMFDHNAQQTGKKGG